ncbi:hypothetical protein [Bacillus aerolatus]|uniref:hypothetical protein n=1 Tax=Bacillus aerolatus TaxID=2653354 RepID=UPI0017814E0E|nr:hypothetical protein [Bacillus aerolatus]
MYYTYVLILVVREKVAQEQQSSPIMFPELVRHFALELNEQPVGVLYMMQAVIALYEGGREIAFAGSSDEKNNCLWS